VTTRESDVLNIRQAAAYLGAHEQTVRKLARRGGIPSFKVGRDWRFRKEAILRWSEEQQRGGGRWSVLVVDDDEAFCRLTGCMLERFGCRARLAFGGREGLHLVGQEAPDVILLDLLMPDMNGLQFLEELRRTHPSLPVVLVTGHPESDLMGQAMLHAPVMLLSKPIRADLLERTVRAVAGGMVAGVTREAER
jgi:excisionase family DNA binding protein